MPSPISLTKTGVLISHHVGDGIRNWLATASTGRERDHRYGGARRPFWLNWSDDDHALLFASFGAISGGAFCAAAVLATRQDQCGSDERR